MTTNTEISPLHTLQTLVLNSSYEPLSTYPLSLIPATEAITKIWLDRVQIVETWKDAFGNEAVFRSPSISIPAPMVIALNDYVSVSGVAKFSRKNVLLRDRFTCQYCGKRFPSSELTFDHVIPREKGGVTRWDNILMACEPCNSGKANKLPNFSGRKRKSGDWRPLKMPYIPTHAELLRAGMEFVSAQIKQDFGSYLYWEIPLLE